MDKLNTTPQLKTEGGGYRFTQAMNGHAIVARISRIRKKKDTSQTGPQAVEEAREAFRKMYPKTSLRGQSRKNRLFRAKAFRRKKSKK